MGSKFTGVTDAATSARMGRIRQHATAAELALRSCLHQFGVRFRVMNRDLPGSPDLANRRGKWAILVHGCFWHRHRGCPRTTTPKRNRDFWEAKFRDNCRRDAAVLSSLRRLGFRTLVVWECESESAGARGKISKFFSNLRMQSIVGARGLAWKSVEDYKPHGAPRRPDSETTHGGAREDRGQDAGAAQAHRNRSGEPGSSRPRGRAAAARNDTREAARGSAARIPRHRPRRDGR